MAIAPKIRPLLTWLLSFWWISWFGILGGFLLVGGWECKREFAQGRGSSPSLAILIIVPLSWIAFFVADKKARSREPMIVNLLTMVGTLLAVFTLLGIFFFVHIAPGIQ